MYVTTYEAEGWRSSSLEKLKPSKEIENAKIKIMKCKDTIRSILKEVQARCDSDEKVQEIMHPSSAEGIDVTLIYIVLGKSFFINML